MAEEAEVMTDRALDESLTESLRANLRDIQSRPAEETGLEPAEPAAEPAEAAPVTEGERPRDASGKFLPKEPAAPAVVAPVTAEPAAPEAAPTFDINRAPSSWKPAAKAEWAKIPEGIRAEIHRREGDFHATVLKPLREDATFGQSIKAVLAPYQMLIEAEGGTPDRAIADTMKTAALFRVGQPQQKLEALWGIDRQFNCGLQAQFNQAVAAEVAKQTGQQPQAPAQPQGPLMDPRVDQILAGMQQQERARNAEVERTSNAAVEQFITAKDEAGQPRYPFVDNVLQDMVERVSILRRQNPALNHSEALDQAYSAAIWANPETRAVLLAQQQAQAGKPEANLQRVEQAKRASGANLPKRGALPASTSVGPLKLGTAESDESIRETYRQLQANA